MFSPFPFMFLYYCCILLLGLCFSNHFCCTLILSFQSIGFMSYYYMFLENGGNPLSILAWRISWTEDLGGLQSMGHKELDMPEQLTFHVLCGFIFKNMLKTFFLITECSLLESKGSASFYF